MEENFRIPKSDGDLLTTYELEFILDNLHKSDDDFI